MRIVESAFNTNWYDGSLRYRKLILIIMMRVDDGEVLTAWKFMKVNMSTYGWVIFKNL